MKRKFFSILLTLVLLASFSLVTAVPVGAQEAPTVTLDIPDNVYRPAEFDASSTTTNLGTAYDHVRFNITVSGLEPFTGTRADIFEITESDDPKGVQGFNETFVLVDGDFVGFWGPEGGFSLAADYEVTSVFTVQMNDGTTAPLGDYEVTVALVDLAGEEPVTLDTATDSFSLSADTLYVGSGQQFTTIQSAIDDAAADDTINVVAGIYDEQVEINQSLTLQGAGDTTIIQPSTTTASTLTVKAAPWYGGWKDMAAIVWVDTSGGTVTVKDLKIDGVNISETDKPAAIGGNEWVTGLAYLETSGTVDTVTVEDMYISDGIYRTCGIWTSAITHPSTVEVKYCTVINNNRAGIYGLGAELTVNFNHNTMTGPGTLANQVPNGIFLMVDCIGSCTYNTISQYHYSGESYRSSGIATYYAGAGLTFGHNTISDVDNAFALSMYTIGIIVEYNTVYDCHTGVRIEYGAESSVIQYNDIHDNEFAIRCGPEMGTGNEAHFNDFVDNPGLEWTNAGEGCTYEGAVCNLHEEYDLDAINNYWGNASGPEHEVPFEALDWPKNPGGTGDSVSDDVSYIPWLTRNFQTVLADNIAYFGFPVVYLNTGWNTFSTPIALDPACATWGSYKELGDGLSLYNPEQEEYVNAYYFLNNGEAQGFVEVDNNYRLRPCDAIYVQMAEPDIAAILWSPDVSISSKELYAGWNLVSSAGLPVVNPPGYECPPAHIVLQSVYWVPGDLHGYKLAVNPPVNWNRGGEYWNHYWRDGGEYVPMCPTLGYWVLMNNDGTLAGLSSTPIPLMPPDGH